MTKTLEEKAKAVGDTPELLRKQLKSARSVLTEYWRRIMSTPKTVFDIKNKRMVSPFGLGTSYNGS